jgi:hypothetical protein
MAHRRRSNSGVTSWNAIQIQIARENLKFTESSPDRTSSCSGGPNRTAKFGWYARTESPPCRHLLGGNQLPNMSHRRNNTGVASRHTSCCARVTPGLSFLISSSLLSLILVAEPRYGQIV